MANIDVTSTATSASSWRTHKYLLLAVALLLIGGVAAAIAVVLRPWASNEIAVEYAGEKGNGATEGVVNSPLKVTLRIPWSDGSAESALAAVSLQLLDEAGSPAQFGGKTENPFPMKPAMQIGVWEHVGSVPSRPGTYRARFQLHSLSDRANVQTIELNKPGLRAIEDPAPPLRTGYVFPLEANLWILSTDAARQLRLTYFPPATEYADEPAWSPDGGTLAFAYLPPTAPSELPRTEIWTMKPDGSDMKRLAAPADREVLADPAWSRDGKYVYFAVDTLPDMNVTPPSQSSENRRIDRIDVLTGARSPVALGAQMPSTGGPGDDLLYLEDTPPAELGGVPGQQIVRAGADGSGESVLVGPGKYQFLYGQKMSPDGKWVVFSAPSGGPPQEGGFNLLRWLLLEPETAYAHELPWELYLVSSSGGEVTQLTAMNEDQPHPVWLDERTVAFMGKSGLYKVDIDEAGKAVGQPAKVHPGAQHGTLTWHGP